MSENEVYDGPAKKTSPPLKKSEDFLVVGLGASAGGIQALKQFFAHTPPQSGIAYVVILHLSPDHDSKLAEILQLAAPMPVTQVRETVKIEPDHVYVIPPNQSLSMRDGLLTLSEMKRPEERRIPVDNFFRALAEANHSRAVSAILSGTGANGSIGIKRIKELGGFILAQDPVEAEFKDMPRHAISTGLVDSVLPAAEMPARILAYQQHLGATRVPIDHWEQIEPDESAVREILTLLRVRIGHDFSNYKRPTILRRIGRRMVVTGLRELSAYTRYLNEHLDELQALLQDLLISVTNFFRDADAFAALRKEVIPRLFESKGKEAEIRVWVPGCATGEEAYSIAMLLAEQSNSHFNMPAIQVFATDIDERAIAAAREGLYTESATADIPPELLRRFFFKELDGYRVRKELREVVLFAIHNAIKDPPFSHLNLISCRNLLIYLNRGAQERLMNTFHFALEPGGYLFLGSSESAESSGDLFLAFDKEHRIYQSRAVPPRLVIPMPSNLGSLRFTAQEPPKHSLEEQSQDWVTYSSLHQKLLEQYAPPSVVVDEDHRIVHLSDRAGRYLQFAGGEPSHNLIRAVRPELRLELHAALFQAAQRRTEVQTRSMNVKLDDKLQEVSLIVRPVFSPADPTRGFILIVFNETPPSEGHAPPEAAVSQPESVVERLEDELARTKAQLRGTIEQYELQQEEQKASNEEPQAMNEELRSAAEELETGKEELQSVNEELNTVNQELKIKIEELSQANNDFQNLMASTDIATIFLDRHLRIKLFTRRACDIFNLIRADINRPLLDITHRLLYEGLAADVEMVLSNPQTIEREVETRDGICYQMCLLPYRTSEDRIEGVIVTLVDISRRKQAETELAEMLMREQAARIEAEKANKVKDEFLAILSHELKNPLNVVLVNAELIKRLPEAQGQPRVKEALEKIRQTALVQARMIDDLLDLSRLQMGKYAINLQPVDLGPLLEDAAAMVREEASAKEISLEIRLPSEKLVIEADAARLQQIVWNLLNNSIKFTPPGGKIELQLEREHGKAKLTVADNGEGIAPEFMQYLFEMFRQADASTTKRKGGMGIGLTLTRQLVELHRGRIEAFSEGPGKGTRITVWLPISRNEAVTQPAAQPAPVSVREVRGLRILVVDDLLDTVEPLHDLLKMEGALVKTATSGAEALQIAEETDFDLIISDIAMPEMDGYQLLKELRARPRTAAVPVIALTGFGRIGDEQEILSAGFSAHLKKPVVLDTLAKAVGKAIKPRAEDER